MCMLPEFMHHKNSVNESEDLKDAKQLEIKNNISFSFKQINNREIITSKVQSKSNNTDRLISATKEMELLSKETQINPFVSYIEIVDSSNIEKNLW